MRGNEKIAVTAEAVSFMRAYLNSEKYSKYFISSRIKKRFNIILHFLPKSHLEKMFRLRNSLSEDLDRVIKLYRPEQIIELACGYSPRGLIMTKKDPKLIYIETDFSSVLEHKKKILQQIKEKEKITISKNHHLIKIDILSQNLLKSLKHLINKKKKTLIIAEALNSYLTPEEYEFSIKNITGLLEYVEKGAYLSHDNTKFLTGFFGKILMFYRNNLTKTRSYKHFRDSKSIKSYFLNKNFKKVMIIDSKKSNNLIYLAIRK